MSEDQDRAIANMKHARTEEQAYRERELTRTPRPVTVGDTIRLAERTYEVIRFDEDGKRVLALMTRADNKPTHSYRYIYLSQALHLDYSPISLEDDV